MSIENNSLERLFKTWHMSNGGKNYGGGLGQSLLLNDSKDLENVPDTFNLPAPTVQEK